MAAKKKMTFEESMNRLEEIVSLLGRGAGPGEAAVCAVWLHGRAGDLAARELTAYAMAPSDLLRWLPAAFHSLDQ